MSKSSQTRALETALAPRERHPNNPPQKTIGRMADDILRYCTIDPVNLELAWDVAEPFGLTIDHREPRDGPVPGPALLIDAAHWWLSSDERKKGLERLVAQEGRGVVAVHSWLFDEEQIDWLEANGIRASDRLDSVLIARIATDLASLTARSYEPIHVK
jgi:hypothetical protein